MFWNRWERTFRTPQFMAHLRSYFNYGLFRARKWLLMTSRPSSARAAPILLFLYLPYGAARLVLKLLTTSSTAPKGRLLMIVTTSSIVEASYGVT